MSHPPFPHLVERNQKLVAAYNANPDTPRADLARRFGMTPQAVDRTLREAGVEKTGRRRRLAAHELRPISNLHAALGRLLEEELKKTRPGSLTEHAHQSEVGSPMRLSALLAGLQDITLGELQRLAEYLRTTPAALLAAATDREGLICKTRPIPPKAFG